MNVLPESPIKALFEMTESAHSRLKMGGSGNLPIGVDPYLGMSAF
jgi:hypothetical protein